MSSCKDCPRRSINCHNVNTCAEWAEREAAKQIIPAVDRNKIVYEYKKSSKNKYYSSHGKKGRR